MTPSLEGTKKHLVGCKKREKIEKVTGSRDDKGEGGASIDFGCTDPMSQKRDLGHPSIVTDAALLARLIELSTFG